MSKFKNLFLSWHMIIRGHTDEAIKCIESLQGLYDECIIAVDDREDSDEVYERLLYYPNILAYRQSFIQFGRYDLARQDALNRVSPYADFIGWCDHDEILISPKPIEIRQWLHETQPDAVDVGLLYEGDIGGHISGNIYYRTRIWKKSVERMWQRPCHEHPTPVNGQDNPILNKDIIFKHIKLDNSEYRATHHIELMQKEIDGGSLGWIFYQAREYKYLNNYQMARKLYIEYLKSGFSDDLVRAIEELDSVTSDKAEYINSLLEIATLKKDNAIIWEYLALAEFYYGDKELAKNYHKTAKNIDSSNSISFIHGNDPWLT